MVFCLGFELSVSNTYFSVLPSPPLFFPHPWCICTQWNSLFFSFFFSSLWKLLFFYLSAINYAFDHTSALCLPRSTRNIFPRITFDHPRQTDTHTQLKRICLHHLPRTSLSLSICVISTPISISISSLSLTTYTISLNLNRVLFFFRVAVEYYLFYLFIAMPMPICLNRYLVPFEVKNRVSIFFFFSFLLWDWFLYDRRAFASLASRRDRFVFGCTVRGFFFQDCLRVPTGGIATGCKLVFWTHQCVAGSWIFSSSKIAFMCQSIQFQVSII